MKTLAEMSFEYVWLLLFGNEDTVDREYASSMSGAISDFFQSMDDSERAAFSQAAAKAKAGLLAEPDEYGYTPRKLVTEHEKIFLDAAISGDIYE